MRPKEPNDPERPNEDEVELTYAASLLVRSYLSDGGVRPGFASKSLNFYSSPAIKTSLDVIHAGDHVNLQVLVENKSLTNAPAQFVRADFWWADPSIGPIVPSMATYIGQSEPLETIIPGPGQWLNCAKTWEVQNSQGCHECLIVQVHSSSETVQYPFQPNLDCRVAQRNLTVLPPDAPSTMTLGLTNPFWVKELTLVRVQTWQIRGFDPLLEREFGVPATDLLAHAGEPHISDLLARFGVEVTVGEPGKDVRIVEFSRETEISTFGKEVEELLRGQRPDSNNLDKVIVETTLSSASMKQVTLDFSSRTDGDAIYVHKFTQVSRGINVGGYTVVMTPN